MIDLERTGKFIARCRREKQLTQKQLAEKLHVTDRAVSKWENGRSFPDVDLLEDLCRELEISVSDLLAGKRLEEKEYRKETEHILTASISSSQLYGFQIVLYLQQFTALLLFYLPFFRSDFLPTVTGENLACWGCSLILLGCVFYLDRKIPGREFRGSSPLLEGAAGGVLFGLMMLYIFRPSKTEGVLVSDQIVGYLTAFLGLLAVIAIRAGKARFRRRSMGKDPGK